MAKARIVSTLLSVIVGSGAIAAGETLRFEPTTGVPTFAVRPPVLRVKPGDIVETRTFSKPGDYYERDGGAWPGEVGPFYYRRRDARGYPRRPDRAAAAQSRHGRVGDQSGRHERRRG